MGVHRRGLGCAMGLLKGSLRGEGWGEGEPAGWAAVVMLSEAEASLTGPVRGEPVEPRTPLPHPVYPCEASPALTPHPYTPSLTGR